MKGYKFTESEQVAHIENLTLPMRVVGIKWKTRNVSTGKLVPGKGDDTGEVFEKKEKRMLDGIVCQWWKSDELIEKRFHSETLVPWVVAQKGREQAEEWLQEMKEAKYIK